MKNVFRLGVLVFATLILTSCTQSTPQKTALNREDTIPTDVEKVTPETDAYPPILHSSEFQAPIPVPGINTAGIEDSPFIPADRDELYFVFIKDAREDAQVQIQDPVNGIWVSKKADSAWQDPSLVMLQKSGTAALNGCPFVQGETMMFCSTRDGYPGMHWFSADLKNDKWSNWTNTDFDPAFDVGELHIWNQELYYHSVRVGGKGGFDIWMLDSSDNTWKDPINIESVNSSSDELMPYLTTDGNELWFTRTHQGSPAIFRSQRINGGWQQPELMISQFAGEPTLDRAGNLYFVHSFFKDNSLIESDIYVANKK